MCNRDVIFIEMHNGLVYVCLHGSRNSFYFLNWINEYKRVFDYITAPVCREWEFWISWVAGSILYCQCPTTSPVCGRTCWFDCWIRSIPNDDQTGIQRHDDSKLIF